MTRLTLLVPAAAAALVALVPGPALAASGPPAAALRGPALSGPGTPAPGLPGVSSGHRPGPDVLYAPAATAPQLQNTGVWSAAPLLVSGATGYEGGEWLYQDELQDDHGAIGTPDSTTPYGTGAFLFSAVQGTYTYPTDPSFAGNAADLVELRVKPLTDATAFRVTLNSLADPARTAVTVALGGTPAVTHAWPHGAGVSSPAAYFLTVHGTTAELTDAVTGLALAPAPTASWDTARRQLQVTVPHAAWAPGTSTVRTTVGVGLWDTAAGAWQAPAAGSATATAPGGGSPSRPVAVVNVGPRTAEPFPAVKGKGYTIGDTAVVGTADAPWWRESQQARQLTLGDVSPFSADVDFAKLAAGSTDLSGVPRTGPLNRILASALVYGQGIDPTRVCTDVAGGVSSTAACTGRFVGQLQPYSLYVPARPTPAAGWSTTLLLHSLSANYNQYAASVNQSELGDRGAGSLVLTPNGRGPDGFYMGTTEADTFEVWADVARHYPLDGGKAVVTGYSMGGFGTYRLLARWPDLFSRGFSVVGIPGTVADQLASLRNTPLELWNGNVDELVPVTQSEPALAADQAAGLVVASDLYNTSDHLTLATNDEYAPGVAALADGTVDRSPPHVTFVVDPTEDNATAGVVSDHAYWLSGLALRDPVAAAHTGTVDVRSEGFGVGDAPVLPVTTTPGTLTGGAYVLPFVRRDQQRGPAPAAPVADRLVVRATNVRTVSIDTARARVDCAVVLDVVTDGPLTVDLPGCGRIESFSAGPAAVVPEVPVAALLPLAGLGAVLLTVVRRRRRAA